MVYRALLAVLTAMVLAGVPAHSALAQVGVKVENLVMSSSQRPEDHSAWFPAGTTEVYALFDYHDASNHRIDVIVEGSGLPGIVEKSDVYQGSGQATVPISGSDIYGALVSKLVDDSEVAQSNAKKAADSATSGVVYLQSVMAAVNQMKSTLGLLGQLELPSAQDRLLKDVETKVNALEEQTNDALDADSDEARHEMAGAVEGAANDLISSARALADNAEGVEAVPIPPTDQGEYTVQVKLIGSPAISTEFRVTEESPGSLNATEPAATKTPPAEDPSGNDGPTSSSGVAPRSSAAGRPTSATGSSASSSEKDEGAEAPGEPRSRSATPGQAPPRATSAQAPAGGEVDMAAEGVIGQPVLEAPQPMEDEQPPAEFDASAGGREAEAAPTWTVPALRGGMPAEPQPEAAPSSEGGRGGSPGPNLAFLTIGAVVLVGVALWLRRRV